MLSLLAQLSDADVACLLALVYSLHRCPFALSAAFGASCSHVCWFEDNTFALRLASLLDTSSSAIRDQMTVCNVVGGRTVVTVGGFQAATFNMTRLQLPRATRADLLGVDVLIIATSLADGGTLGLHFYLNNSANDDYVPVGPAPVCIA